MLLAFAIIALLGVLTPLVLALALGDRAGAVLDGIRDSMVRHNAAIISVLCVVIGAKLIGDAIAGLSA